MDGGDCGAPMMMDGPEAAPDARGWLAYLIGRYVLLPAGGFLLGVLIMSQDTVSKDGLRQAIAEISQRCGK